MVLPLLMFLLGFILQEQNKMLDVLSDFDNKWEEMFFCICIIKVNYVMTSSTLHLVSPELISILHTMLLAYQGW